MLWTLAAPLRVVAGVIRDEVAVQRLQRRQTRLRERLPCYSNSEIDAALARRRRRKQQPLANETLHTQRLARFF